ncbi:type III PLP-dependent enzyme [Domibacillus iocasae]|uniref:Diaminopimelate decarboxylase n=1 Tax=Domibacillus iocasae TaxID=1714016 RepID=A0A1E7DNW0_9BACI|nr:type III PLP-dependent enzyme [Domibacillus iocasae]OES44772.1 diaminopimelate decarboxylase [Domibacillus iocasae]
MNPNVESLVKSIHHQAADPLCAYIYDLVGIQQHAAQMVKTMPEQTHLFYAIKANPNKRIIKELLPFVKGFEVASIGELLKVREVSDQVPILFGGPGKKEYELEMALEKNVSFIHVESLLELKKLCFLAKKKEKTISVLFRMNIRSSALPKTNISMGGRPSQFGLDEPLLREAISIVKSEENTHVHLRGFHFHSLSNNLQADLHVEMVNHYIEKVKQWEKIYQLNVDIINAGGGFGVSYDDTPQFDWHRFTTGLGNSEAFGKLGDKQLFFEPGRFIVANYGYYAAEVVDIKQAAGQFFAVLRGGTHHNRLPASWRHNHPFAVIPFGKWPYPFERPEVRNTTVTIVGELCTPKDQLHENAEIEQLRAGDVVVFKQSGAYCWTISHHDFLGHPHPDFYYVTERTNHEQNHHSTEKQYS